MDAREGNVDRSAESGEKPRVPPPVALTIALGGPMRRVLLLALSVSGALALSACPAKPKKGECKTSQDCASQEGFGQVCVEGRCQECGQDGDCKAGFVCRENKCQPKPQCGTDADCPDGQ